MSKVNEENANRGTRKWYRRLKHTRILEPKIEKVTPTVPSAFFPKFHPGSGTKASEKASFAQSGRQSRRGRIRDFHPSRAKNRKATIRVQKPLREIRVLLSRHKRATQIRQARLVLTLRRRSDGVVVPRREGERGRPRRRRRGAGQRVEEGKWEAAKASPKDYDSFCRSSSLISLDSREAFRGPAKHSLEIITLMASPEEKAVGYIGGWWPTPSVFLARNVKATPRAPVSMAKHGTDGIMLHPRAKVYRTGEGGGGAQRGCNGGGTGVRTPSPGRSNTPSLSSRQCIMPFCRGTGDNECARPAGK